MKKYWHKLTKKEYKAILKSGITVEEALKKYSQPDWCSYQDAIDGVMGCWSLTGSNRTKISEEFCKTCDCSSNFTES